SCRSCSPRSNGMSAARAGCAPAGVGLTRRDLPSKSQSRSYLAPKLTETEDSSNLPCKVGSLTNDCRGNKLCLPDQEKHTNKRSKICSNYQSETPLMKELGISLRNACARVHVINQTFRLCPIFVVW